jgi:hypothetical protein
MIRWLSGMMLAAVLLLGSGCMYTHVRFPMDTDFQETRLGEKQGRARYHAVLWLVAWGDAGSQAAARQGELTTIRHADREIFALLFGLYMRHTTVVYGD